MNKSESETFDNFILRVKYSTVMRLMNLNVGDVVRIMADLDEGHYEELEVENLFIPRERRWDFIRDGVRYNKEPIHILYRVVDVDEGIPYVEPIPPKGYETHFDANSYSSGNLLEIVDSLIQQSYVFDSGYDEDDLDDGIKQANNLTKAIELDKDYADSLIFDHEYIPYEKEIERIKEYEKHFNNIQAQDKKEKEDIDFFLNNEERSYVDRVIGSIFRGTAR